MTLLGSIKNYAWIFVVLISLLVLWGTINKMKGKIFFRVSFGLLRALIFFAIFFNPLLNQPSLPSMIFFEVGGMILLLIGLTLCLAGIKELVKTRLGGIKGIPDKIITTGFYAVIRHPINLGFILVFCGWYIMWTGAYSMIFLPILVTAFVIVSFYEEKNLIKAFGDEYLEYKKRVGMFIPKPGKRTSK